jgi:glutathione S-transferase
VQPVRIVGSYLSPYVRKVLVVLYIKGVPYRIDPIVPFFGGDEFARLSPLRRIPVFIDDHTTLCDSTVICEYLEERYPEPSVMPGQAHDRARLRWLEEFADSRMGEVFIWRYFNELVIRRAVWGEVPDAAIVGKAMEEEIPSILDYLETQVPDHGFLAGAALSVADIAIGSMFRNAGFARFTIDATRWPRTAPYVETVLSTSPFCALAPLEEVLMTTPIENSRAALLDRGAPLTDETLGTSSPRRGVMTI